MQSWTITTLDELNEVVKEILAKCAPQEHAHVFALSGDLGAGKTAFVKACAKELGITEDITSPTFVLMKSYDVSSHSFFSTLTHIDVYRLEDESEASVLNLDPHLANKAELICIEWPERIAGLIPEDAHKISLTLETDGTRTITYDH